MKKTLMVALACLLLSGCIYDFLPYYFDDYGYEETDYNELYCFDFLATQAEVEETNAKIERILRKTGQQNPQIIKRTLGFSLEITKKSRIDIYLSAGVSQECYIECYGDFSQGLANPDFDWDFICEVINVVAEKTLKKEEIAEFFSDNNKQYSAKRSRIRELSEYYGKVLDYKTKDDFSVSGKSFKLIIFENEKMDDFLLLRIKTKKSSADLAMFEEMTKLSDKKAYKLAGIRYFVEYRQQTADHSYLSYSIDYFQDSFDFILQQTSIINSYEETLVNIDVDLLATIINSVKAKTTTAEELRAYIVNECDRQSDDHSLDFFDYYYYDDYLNELSVSYRIAGGSETLYIQLFIEK